MPPGYVLLRYEGTTPIYGRRKLSPERAEKVNAVQSVVIQKAIKPARPMSAPALNKTEQRWQDAHPSHIAFPLRLRWGKCMNYKPDFMDMIKDGKPNLRPRLIEIKGFERSRDIVRFKGCAAEWSWLFSFELWEWKNKTWARIY